MAIGTSFSRVPNNDQYRKYHEMAADSRLKVQQLGKKLLDGTTDAVSIRHLRHRLLACYWAIGFHQEAADQAKVIDGPIDPYLVQISGNHEPAEKILSDLVARKLLDQRPEIKTSARVPEPKGVVKPESIPSRPDWMSDF